VLSADRAGLPNHGPNCGGTTRVRDKRTAFFVCVPARIRPLRRYASRSNVAGLPEIVLFGTLKTNGPTRRSRGRGAQATRDRIPARLAYIPEEMKRTIIQSREGHGASSDSEGAFQPGSARLSRINPEKTTQVSCSLKAKTPSELASFLE
jgi:hypothetical protein